LENIVLKNGLTSKLNKKERVILIKMLIILVNLLFYKNKKKIEGLN